MFYLFCSNLLFEWLQVRLRQLDMNLLGQLWNLNESIQDFKHSLADRMSETTSECSSFSLENPMLEVLEEEHIYENEMFHTHKYENVEYHVNEDGQRQAVVAEVTSQGTSRGVSSQVVTSDQAKKPLTSHHIPETAEPPARPPKLEVPVYDDNVYEPVYLEPVSCKAKTDAGYPCMLNSPANQRHTPKPKLKFSATSYETTC